MRFVAMNRLTISCAAAVGAGVIFVGTASFYLYKLNNTLLQELAHLSELLTELRKEIADLKTLSKRKPAIGSNFGDETDVYYDFSDEGYSLPQSHSVLLHVQEEDTPDIAQQTFLSDEDSIRDIDILLENLNAKSGANGINTYQTILNYKEKFCSNPEYMWRLAKATHLCGQIAGEQGNATKKQQFAFEAVKYASAALALTDDNANVHKWYAITLGNCSEYEAVQKKLQNGFAFKEHTLAAIHLNPTDESLYYLLGRWSFEVATLSWIERKVATTLFGEVPAASYEDARNHFLEVERLRTNGIWKENRLFIAKTYIGESNYAKAIVWLDKAVEGEVVEKSDFLILKDIEDLRRKYSSYRV